jgi:hypothetical protein
MDEAAFTALFDPAPFVRHLDGVFARLEKLEVSDPAPGEGPGKHEG